MPESVPQLSIGLPVYNGERYLAAALGSLVDQAFTDFELIICDNASSDGTEEICRAFAAADPRIRYQRNPENLGAAKNYNRTVELARGRYFKWAAHDDVCAPDYLLRCVTWMDQYPNTVLCHSLSAGIDENGNRLGRYDQEVETMQNIPWQRFWRMISVPHVCIPVFGVMRLETLRKTPMHGEYVGADRNLLAELSLIGQIRLIPEELFQRRHHAEASISKFKDERERLAWFNPALSGSGSGSRPTWRRLREYAASIRRVHLTSLQKLLCSLQLLRWLGARHHDGPINGSLLLKELLR